MRRRGGEGEEEEKRRRGGEGEERLPPPLSSRPTGVKGIPVRGVVGEFLNKKLTRLHSRKTVTFIKCQVSQYFFVR
jgi:hypothetical protein